MSQCEKLRSTSTSVGILLASVAFISGALLTTPVSALPSLQLGPGSDPGWSYDTGTQTWVYQGTQPFTLNTYANATGADGGNGDYAWATAPDANQYAYLVAAAVPKLGDIGDIFNVTVSGAAQVASGYGAPPVEDPNSLAPHGIFDTYFEIFEFNFDGPLVTIENTQPPGGDPGQGYNEGFSVTWSDLTGGSVTGLHFDLFTVAGEGRYVPGGSADRNLVEAFAPFSHDAEYAPPDDELPPDAIPEPSVLALFGIGMLGLGLSRRRHVAKT